MAEHRPNKLTPEMAVSAARRTAACLAKNGMIEDSDIDRIAADIAKHGRPYMDGYELAKTLDDRCNWYCNLNMAEELDRFSIEALREIEIAEKEWAEREAITAPLAIGTRVKLNGGETGEITEIYKYGTAKFLIRIDDDEKATPPHNSRRIVNFEDVRAL